MSVALTEDDIGELIYQNDSTNSSIDTPTNDQMYIELAGLPSESVENDEEASKKIFEAIKMDSVGFEEAPTEESHIEVADVIAQTEKLEENLFDSQDKPLETSLHDSSIKENIKEAKDSTIILLAQTQPISSQMDTTDCQNISENDENDKTAFVEQLPEEIAAINITVTESDQVSSENVNSCENETPNAFVDDEEDAREEIFIVEEIAKTTENENELLKSQDEPLETSVYEEPSIINVEEKGIDSAAVIVNKQAQFDSSQILNLDFQKYLENSENSKDRPIEQNSKETEQVSSENVNSCDYEMLNALAANQDDAKSELVSIINEMAKIDEPNEQAEWEIAQPLFADSDIEFKELENVSKDAPKVDENSFSSPAQNEKNAHSTSQINCEVIQSEMDVCNEENEDVKTSFIANDEQPAKIISDAMNVSSVQSDHSIIETHKSNDSKVQFDEENCSLLLDGQFETETEYVYEQNNSNAALPDGNVDHIEDEPIENLTKADVVVSLEDEVGKIEIAVENDLDSAVNQVGDVIQDEIDGEIVEYLDEEIEKFEIAEDNTSVISENQVEDAITAEINEGGVEYFEDEEEKIEMAIENNSLTTENQFEDAIQAEIDGESIDGDEEKNEEENNSVNTEKEVEDVVENGINEEGVEYLEDEVEKIDINIEQALTHIDNKIENSIQDSVKDEIVERLEDEVEKIEITLEKDFVSSETHENENNFETLISPDIESQETETIGTTPENATQNNVDSNETISDEKTAIESSMIQKDEEIANEDSEIFELDGIHPKVEIEECQQNHKIPKTDETVEKNIENEESKESACEKKLFNEFHSDQKECAVEKSVLADEAESNQSSAEAQQTNESLSNEVEASLIKNESVESDEVVHSVSVTEQVNETECSVVDNKEISTIDEQQVTNISNPSKYSADNEKFEENEEVKESFSVAAQLDTSIAQQESEIIHNEATVERNIQDPFDAPPQSTNNKETEILAEPNISVAIDQKQTQTNKSLLGTPDAQNTPNVPLSSKKTDTSNASKNKEIVSSTPFVPMGQNLKQFGQSADIVTPQKSTITRALRKQVVNSAAIDECDMPTPKSKRTMHSIVDSTVNESNASLGVTMSASRSKRVRNAPKRFIDESDYVLFMTPPKGRSKLVNDSASISNETEMNSRIKRRINATAATEVDKSQSKNFYNFINGFYIANEKHFFCSPISR